MRSKKLYNNKRRRFVQKQKSNYSRKNRSVIFKNEHKINEYEFCLLRK